MSRIVGIFQLFLSGVLGVTALAALFNMVMIAMRPETISVANASMGLLVVIIFLAVWSRVFFVKGRERIKVAETEAAQSRELRKSKEI